MNEQNVLNQLPFLAWTYTASGVIDFVNTAWIKYTGLQLKETKSQEWATLLPPNELLLFLKSLRQAFTSKVDFRYEIGIRQHVSGKVFRRHVVFIEPHSDEHGNVVSWLGTSIDIEEYRKAEDEHCMQKQRYQREQETSTAFQHAALPPHLPTVAGLSFDALYEPGHSERQIGGDWYDAIRLLDGRVVVTIGDVSGHGLNASVIMGVVRQIFRGIAQLHAEPVTMLDAADRALRLEYPDVIVTAWIGIFDLVEQALTYASAGHPPPLLLRADKTVRELDHLTLPIGLRQGHQGHASRMTLETGDTVWLYTDGLIEGTRDIVAGCKLLQETAQRLADSAESYKAENIRHVVIPNGSPDDVAILVVTTDLHESEKYLSRSSLDSNNASAAITARRAFAKSLSPKEFTDLEIMNAEVVFGELCGNVARYAPGKMDIIVDRSGPQMVLHILDRGSGFQHLSRLPGDMFSEKGRGLFLVAAMTSEFTVTQRVGGGSSAHAVLVGRRPLNLLLDDERPVTSDQVGDTF